MLKNKITASLAVGGMALVGLVSGIAAMANAQSVTTVNPSKEIKVAPSTTGTLESVGTNEVSSKPDTDSVDGEQGGRRDVPDQIDQQGGHVDGANDKNGVEVKDVNEPTSSLDNASE